MFERTLKIIDNEKIEKLKQTQVLLVGLGGVGGFALEALVRLGIENMTIIDNDTIEKSNLNRQIISTEDNIGKLKTEVAKNRAFSINPNINIKEYSIFLNAENIDTIFNEPYDFILDACDTITTKVLLIEKAKEYNCQIISCMGTGNRLNPSDVIITTLDKTTNDPLAKVMRELLRKKNLSLKVPVVWSRELPIKTPDRTPGSIIFVPAAAGLLLAYFVLNNIEKK